MLSGSFLKAISWTCGSVEKQPTSWLEPLTQSGAGKAAEPATPRLKNAWIGKAVDRCF